MFLVWGNKWKYQPKENGLKVSKICPECGTNCEFVEVIPTNYFTLYTIPVFETDSKKPVLECPECHCHIYINSQDREKAKTQHNEPPESPKQTARPTDPMKYSEINCELCQNMLRVPLLKKLIKVTCPKCSCKFHVRNGKAEGEPEWS